MLGTHSLTHFLTHSNNNVPHHPYFSILLPITYYRLHRLLWNKVQQLFWIKKQVCIFLSLSYSMTSSDYSMQVWLCHLALRWHRICDKIVLLFCVYSLCCKLLWFQFYVLVWRIIVFFSFQRFHILWHWVSTNFRFFCLGLRLCWYRF